MEILSIQYLRGCAALLIVFYHLELQLQRVGYEGYWPHFLSAGVDIFFVISGFIMWITTANGMSALEFFRRRIVRVVPLYWLLTSVAVGILIAFPSVMQSGQFDRSHVLASYLFFPVVHPSLGIMVPVLVPGWTLNYEMFFYLIFGLGLFLPAILRLVAVSTILLGLAAIKSLTSVPPFTAIDFYASDRVLEFAFGTALGWLYVGGSKLSPTSAWVCFLFGAASIIFVGDSGMGSRGLLIGIPALLVVAGAVMIERSKGLPNFHSLHLLGNASYSLYLSHTMTLSMIGQLWRRLPLGLFPGSSLVFGCASLAFAIFFGLLIHRYIEMPMLRFGNLQMFSRNKAREF